MNTQQIRARLTRITNLINVIATAQENEVDSWTREMLATLLAQVWELCREVDPEIVTEAGRHINPSDARMRRSATYGKEPGK